MRVETREAEGLGTNGFEAYAVLVGEDSEGQPTAVVTMGVHRIGRTVSVTTLEDGGVGDAIQTVQDGEHAALSAAFERVYALN